METFLPYAITVVLGGGLFKGIEALVKAISASKQQKVILEQVGAKTPAEIESVSVATMTTALESAQDRITALVAERASDREYYQGRIAELNEQLQRVREEMIAMERKLATLLNETRRPDDGRGAM